MAKSDLVQNYCVAVERDDSTAHPIQRADLLPARAFSTAADLYGYTVCPFDADGKPLNPSDSVERARWIIFDNVYVRTSGGGFPKNARRDKAKRAGFSAKGYGRTPKQAEDLWAGAVAEFGRRGESPVAPSTEVPIARDSPARPELALPRLAPGGPLEARMRPVEPGSETAVVEIEGLDDLIQRALVEPRALMSKLGRPESTVFYSNPWLTLRPGSHYIVGFKPGADERVPSQTLAKLLRWPKDKPWSLYLDEEDWQAKNLQQRIRAFADKVIPGGSNALRNTFSSNAIFAHANDATVIGGIEDRLFEICWPWHERFLDKIGPRTILTIGNGPQSAFRLFGGTMRSTKSLGADIPVYNNFSVKAMSGVMDLPTGALDVKLVGLPHLSRCDVASRPAVIREMQSRGWI